MITSKYNKEENIIYVERKGDISIKDLLEYIEELDYKYNDLKTLLLIDDLRNSVSTFLGNDYSSIIKEIETKNE